MVIAERKPRRQAGRPSEAPVAAKAAECLFCHRTADRVTFVVRDREHGYNVCELCIDDCARTVACSCVC